MIPNPNFNPNLQEQELLQNENVARRAQAARQRLLGGVRGYWARREVMPRLTVRVRVRVSGSDDCQDLEADGVRVRIRVRARVRVRGKPEHVHNITVLR